MSAGGATASRDALRARLFQAAIDVLTTIRGMLSGNGVVFIGDERTDTLRRYAREAEFSLEVLPIENDSWRFYLLAPTSA